MEIIKIKLSEVVNAPVQSTEGSVGYDLYASSDPEIIKDRLVYSTGIFLDLPNNIYATLHARSSIYMYGLILANSVGIIDSDYRGELKVIFYTQKDYIPYKMGDRIAQLIFHYKVPTKLEFVSEISETKRGVGGFGSTGL